MASIYLVTGGKLTEENISILARVGEEVRARATHFIIRGDFQVEMEAIEKSGICQQIHAIVIAPMGELGTCVNSERNSCLDFFIVSEGISATM